MSSCMMDLILRACNNIPLYEAGALNLTRPIDELASFSDGLARALVDGLEAQIARVCIEEGVARGR